MKIMSLHTQNRHSGNKGVFQCHLREMSCDVHCVPVNENNNKGQIINESHSGCAINVLVKYKFDPLLEEFNIVILESTNKLKKI